MHIRPPILVSALSIAAPGCGLLPSGAAGGGCGPAGLTGVAVLRPALHVGVAGVRVQGAGAPATAVR